MDSRSVGSLTVASVVLVLIVLAVVPLILRMRSRNTDAQRLPRGARIALVVLAVAVAADVVIFFTALLT